MNIKDVIAIEEVKADLDKGEAFYESQAFGVGVYFRDCIIADIESLILYWNSFKTPWLLPHACK